MATPGSLFATPPEGFTSTTTAQGQLGSFDVINYFVSSKDKLWLSSQQTKGKSDEYFLTNVWEPGGTTGWHTHPGHTLIIVTAGTVTVLGVDIPEDIPGSAVLRLSVLVDNLRLFFWTAFVFLPFAGNVNTPCIYNHFLDQLITLV